MYPPAHILSLPYELRDSIYKEYLHCDGGYQYNFLTGKLRDATGQPIDLALMLTCRQTATEMRGLALQINTINFSTWYSDETHMKALKLDYVTQELEYHKHYFMREGNACITSEIRTYLDHKFPYLAPVIPAFQGRRYIHRHRDAHFEWGQAPSLNRQFVTSTLHCLLYANQDYFLDELAQWHNDKDSLSQNREFWEAAVCPSHDNVVPLDLAPWKILADHELTPLVDMFAVPTTLRSPTSRLRYTKCSLSAAALAIQFLESIPTETRLQIRNIHLVEDRVAVGYAECHAQGFIPFCQENSRLKIERRVDLWRNILLRGHPTQLWGLEGLNTKIGIWAVSGAASSWIIEAAALPSLGMPSDSFRLVVNGNPAPEAATRIMREILRDAAWQSALEECFRRGIYKQPSWEEWRKNDCYIFEGFPDTLADILNGRSIVSFNFDMDAPFDVEQVIQAHRDWPLDKWSTMWGSREPRSVDFPPPLPSYIDLLQEISTSKAFEI